MFATTTIPQQIINNHHLRTGPESTSELSHPHSHSSAVLLSDNMEDKYDLSESQVFPGLSTSADCFFKNY